MDNETKQALRTLRKKLRQAKGRLRNRKLRHGMASRWYFENASRVAQLEDAVFIADMALFQLKKTERLYNEHLKQKRAKPQDKLAGRNMLLPRLGK